MKILKYKFQISKLGIHPSGLQRNENLKVKIQNEILKDKFPYKTFVDIFEIWYKIVGIKI